MLRSVFAIALPALCLCCGYAAAQEFVTEQDFVQSTAVDRLIWPDDAEVAPFPYASPFERTYFVADFIAFRRDDSSDVPMAAVPTAASLTAPSTVILNSNGFDFQNEAGMRLLWGRRINNNVAVEASYFGLLDWTAPIFARDDGTNALGTTGQLSSPFTGFGQPQTQGFDFNTYVASETETKLNNVELNLRGGLDMPYSNVQVTALFGMRYINVRDRFGYRSFSNEPVGGGTLNTADVAAKNDLFGPQLGGSIEFHVERSVWFNFEGKAILLQNEAGQDFSFTTAELSGANATTTLGANSRGRIAFGGDIQGTCIWKFTPSLVGRVGYQAVFLEGLALGSQNFFSNRAFATTSPNELHYKGQMLCHGPFVGLVWTY